MEMIAATSSFTNLSPRDYRFAPQAVEVVIAYKKGRDALVKRLSPQDPSRTQLEQKLKLTEKDEHPHFSVRYTEGGHTDYLIIEKGLSTFNLHTALRKSFSAILKSELTSAMVLDLRALDINDAKKIVEAMASLAALATWKPETFGRKGAEKPKARKLEIKVLSKLDKRAVLSLTERGEAIAQATNLVRTLSDLPSNFLDPSEYKKRAEAFAKARGMKFEYWDTAALKKKNAGAFLAVVQADPSTDSGIAHFHVPAKKKAKKTIALVGKGLCFDTGGYNVKVGDFMNGMHRDMTGSAIAMALTGLVQKLRPDVEVHAFLAIAENHISPSGYKADDVVVASNGLSIEVVNTDAEGRMVLSDTLAIASTFKPDLMLDFATLTGSAIRAIDTRRSAVFSNRAKLADLAVKVGDASGERTWSFPIGDDYKAELKSKVADLLQCAMGRNSDAIYAATFLSEFVAADVPWVHMDLSAAENKGGLGLVDTDTTGYGVRWAMEFIDSVVG